jgi:hypothetical protein
MRTPRFVACTRSKSSRSSCEGVAIFSTRDAHATGTFRSGTIGKLRLAERVLHGNETGETRARFVRLPGLRRHVELQQVAAKVEGRRRAQPATHNTNSAFNVEK